jgi:hypothetical protein
MCYPYQLKALMQPLGAGSGLYEQRIQDINAKEDDG